MRSPPDDDGWDVITSHPTAENLAALAVRARQTEVQTAMVGSGVHMRLPALLTSQCGCGGGSQSHCCEEWRRMQAQCARLLGNLSYLQVNKSAVVQAGGLDALLVAVRRALATISARPVRADGMLALEASAGLMLEATAALANLASGGATRRRCEDLDCETVPLLLRCLRLWEPSPGPVGGLPQPLQAKLNAAAVESARALSNLSFCAALHPRLLDSGAIDALLHVSDRILDGQETVQTEEEDESEDDAGGNDDDSSRCHVVGGADDDEGAATLTCRACARHEGAAVCAVAGCRCAESLAGPLLSRMLQMLLNATSSQLATLADGTRSASLLAPQLLGLLAHACGGARGRRGECAALRAPDLAKRLLAFCQRLLACAPHESARNMLGAGLLPLLTRILLRARLPPHHTPSSTAAAASAFAEAAADTRDGAASSARQDSTDGGGADDGADVPVVLAACSLLHAALRGPETRDCLLSSGGVELPRLYRALHTVSARLSPPTDEFAPASAAAAAAAAAAGGVTPDDFFRFGAGAGGVGAGAGGLPAAGLKLDVRVEAAQQLRQLVESLQAWGAAPGKHALAALEPALYSECSGCHERAATALAELALTPATCHEAGRSALVTRCAQLLGTAPPPTAARLLRALHGLVAGAREVATPLALAGAVPTLLRLTASRRGGGGVRDGAAALLCTMATHGELLGTMVQHHVLSLCAAPLLLSHDEPEMRARAAAACVALASPPHALAQLLAHGETCAVVLLLDDGRRGDRGSRGDDARPPRSEHATAVADQLEQRLVAQQHEASQRRLLMAQMRGAGAVAAAAAASEEGSAAAVERVLHAALLCLRLNGPVQLTSPLLRLLLRGAMGEVAAAERGAPEAERTAARLARGRRHACACVLAHLLREQQRRFAAAAPSLGVLAALALCGALEAEWPQHELADELAAATATHFGFAIEQLELAVHGFLLPR